jgi:nicotinamide-nucleotide amidase
MVPTQVELERRAAVLGEALAARGWRLATAESCTGGWVAQALTAIAGSSAWFEGGFVTYSNAAKIGLIDVPPLTVERHGAVSIETAQAMAEGARRVLGVEVAIAITGVAGPSGGTPAKPVGLVCFGFACDGRATRCVDRHFPGTRTEVRAAAVGYALDECLRLVD